MLSRADYLARYKVFLDHTHRELVRSGYPKGIYGLSKHPLPVGEHGLAVDEEHDLPAMLVDSIVEGAYISRPSLRSSPRRPPAVRRGPRRRKRKARRSLPSWAGTDGEPSARDPLAPA